MKDLSAGQSVTGSFFEQAGLELKRAQRYRLFVSLIVMDLSFVRDLDEDRRARLLGDLLQVVQGNIRAFDNLSRVADNRLALLLPETSRQGAEMAARRLSELIRTSFGQQTQGNLSDTIALEMASYPDAAGAKTITAFLQELSERSSN